jgi:hypothetical protein
MRRDVERVAQLVRHDHRRDAIDVSQFDDLIVDRQRRDRIQPSGRFVVQQQTGLRRERASDGDATALPT